jgi:hypothetical protein
MKISIEIDTGDNWQNSDTVIKLLNSGIEKAKEVISNSLEFDRIKSGTEKDFDSKAESEG